MAGITLQKGIVYGPVLSRRFGRSLGINLMPVDCKVCSFDCVYCEYGRTDILTAQLNPSILPSVEDVKHAVKRALLKPRTIDTLTFSGNGESTLHPQFLEIIIAVKALRDELRPNTELALLSNASAINIEQVLTSLEMIDVPMMKIDAGDEQTFKAVNRPAPDIKFSEIVNGVKELPHLMIQTMFIDGDISNIRGESYKAWVNLIGELHPQQVQIYSAERPPAKPGVLCIEPRKLRHIAKEINSRFGINVESFYRT